MAEAKLQPLQGRDPVVVDPEHYTIESEDDRVRVLRVHYAPGSKSVMHSHPAVVAIFLADGHCRFTYPDGRTEEHHIQKGTSMVMPAMDHLPENLGDTPLEVVLVELKG
jgi:quercetin dioxygenase-like cupin family protein